MLKILILDDDSNKIKKIKEEIIKLSELKEDNIVAVGDIIQAKKELKENDYDILLLDIQVPNRFGDEPWRDGGVRLLKELIGTERYRRPTHIIGITSYDDIFEEFSTEFSEQLWAVVNCGDNSSNWVQQISNKIKYVIDLKKGLRIPLRTKYEYDLAIVTALNKTEFESVINLSNNWNKYEIVNDATNYYTCSFESQQMNVVAATAPEMGMTSSAVLVTKIITNFCPRYLAMVGLVAGIEDKVNIGDILVADPSWDYGSGKFDVDNGKIVFKPDPKQIRISTDIRAKFEEISLDKQLLHEIKDAWPAEKPENDLNIHIGPVGTGASVVADKRIHDYVREHNRNIIGLDMETYGVLYAAENSPKPRPIAFSIKAVCDFGDSSKDDKYQRYAAFVSTRFLYEFATRYLGSNTG